MFERLSLVLRSSSKITVAPEHRRAKLSPLKEGPVVGRILYFAMVLLNAKDIIRMERETLSQFRYLFETHPEAIPSIFWPYICATWDTPARIDHLHHHFASLRELRFEIDNRANQNSELVDGHDIYPRLRIVIDKNGLFMREGMITLNIFVAHERVFTIAFSLYKNKTGQVSAIVGAIQGRKMAAVTDLYRQMTKKTHGIRPRDLMIEVFQMLCRLSGVKKIYAVSESHRQHRHLFYCLKNKQSIPSINYDEVWSDRSGVRCNDAFFELPLKPARKSLNYIASKKRAMYRNRYALLNRLEQALEVGLAAQPLTGHCEYNTKTSPTSGLPYEATNEIENKDNSPVLVR